ncbi:hypothetical protein [Sphingomonas sp. MMS24-J13]|uniref:hypothetical protein n=1 Tax=Sphingomonas sp. MMS24-J13 TaxID=3238686 RepID=UPI00384C3C21
MKTVAIGGAATAVSVPVMWDFLGYSFEAGPFVITVCATLMTRLIVSLNTGGRKRVLLDVSVTALSVLVASLWTQSNDLALLPAGLSGIAFGALGIGIIGLAKSQATIAFRAALHTFVRSLGAGRPPENPDA